MRAGERAIAAAIVVSTAAFAARTLDKRVDVGGYRLHLRCVGEGGPVVVLDAGAGDTLGTWDWVVPGIRKLTRVCAYDRAGLGKSDRGPAPRTSERIVGELAELLRRAEIPPPYVLVGHSFGGLNVRLFAARHPELVAGLVLVDATPESFPDREESLVTPAEREKRRTEMAAGPAAFREEVAAMPSSAAEVRNAVAAAPAGRFPVIVITAARAADPPAFRSAWLDMQRAMAGTFPEGHQVIASASGHYIQFDQPDLVVDAVRDALNARRPGSTPIARDRPGN